MIGFWGKCAINVLRFGVLFWRWGNIPCQIEQICRQCYCGLAEPAVSRFPLSFPWIPSLYLRYEMLTAVCQLLWRAEEQLQAKAQMLSCTFHLHRASTFSELGWDSSRLHSCPVISSHKSGCQFYEFNRSSIDPFSLFPKLWVICCWKWYRSCVAANRKIEICFLWWAGTIPALLFNIFECWS